MCSAAGRQGTVRMKASLGPSVAFSGRFIPERPS